MSTWARRPPPSSVSTSLVTRCSKSLRTTGEIKRESQQRLLDEYEAVQDRYDSYWHFRQETNRQNPALQDLRKKLGFTDRQHNQ